MRTIYSVAVALALGATALPLSAQGKMIQIGFGGGMSVPTSNAKQAFENGVHGRGFMLVNVPGVPTLRFDLSGTKFDWKEAVVGGPTAEGQSQVFAGLANISVNLLKGPIRPYVMAGVGAFNIQNQLESGGTTESSSEMKFGIDGGAGLAIRIMRLEMFVEGRVQNVYTEAGMIDAKSIRTIPVTFGIIF